jgi:phosphoribosylamine--glycine ligase
VKVLLVGSGGREHALAWKLRRSPGLDELHAAPGNPGIAALGACHPVRADDAEGLLGLAGSLGVDLVVIGPEAPLVAGVADRLRHTGIPVFGPSAAAAQIEGSKRFAKDVMRAAGVPTAEPMSVARPPCVVKADGLTAGKGVFVCRSEAELDAGLRAAASLGGPLVIEELLEGEEASLFALADGGNVVPLAAARDYKQIGDGGTGPNTGGMGCFAPVPGLDGAALDELVDRIHRPVVAELAARGAPFVGVLYAGLMLMDDGPRVLEFNCRFGDPEAQTILPLLEGDLLRTLLGAATGDLGDGPDVSDRSAVTVVLAAGDYPAGTDVGSPIEGVDTAARTGALVFHAGTALRAGGLVTNGGRIVNVTGVGPSLEAAREQAYEAAGHISFPGARYRRDIAAETPVRG